MDQTLRPSEPGAGAPIRLGDFVRGNVEAIVVEWASFAATLSPASDRMTVRALRDHAADILQFVTDDMDTAQTGAEQVTKSQGDSPKAGGPNRSAAEVHAASLAAEMLGRVGPLNEKQSLMATGIRDCTTRAARIITDLLDLTRVQLGTDLPFRREPFDLHALGRQLVDEMRVFYPGRAIQLEPGQGDTNGSWDPARMGQVFSNLIGNAVEHGAPGTAVTVALGGGVDVTLAVRNLGPPIPPDAVKRVFEALVRATGEDAPGSAHLGLGLFITSQIVQSHGGSIGVQSDADGTVFTCRLPRAPASG